MSDEFVTCDHHVESLYLINTSVVTWWKDSDIEKPETFNEACKTLLTTHFGADEESILQIIIIRESFSNAVRDWI